MTMAESASAREHELSLEVAGRLRSRLDGILAEARAHQPTLDRAVIERAFEVAAAAHAGQTRRSGEPYLVHPLRVAETIARLGLGEQSLAAGLMHDAVEDSDLTVFELTERFGRGVANLVDGVTKLGKVPYLSRKEQQAESFRKMLLAMSQDIRVLLVKLADRLDNMRTLESMPAAKQERIARETLEIYAPLAARLGIDWIRCELQDLSFRYLEPVSYREVSDKIEALLGRHPDFVDETLERLRTAFDVDTSPNVRPTDAEPATAWDESVWGPVELRASLRNVFKVHLLGQENPGEIQISDLVSYQVITRSRVGCYGALGQLHAVFKPVPGRYRDYISLPRPNHYQALHTSVVDREGRRMDVQIRSEAMDAVAERGIVVDLSTPTSEPVSAAAEARRMAWLDQLMDWQDQVSDPNEFIEAVKADLFADETYVFTPRGDLLTFPPGATPIDFAFAIHTDLGLRCSGARVNGHVVPLRYQLRQGDTVEILADPDVSPKRAWLKMATTSRARAKIKQHLRNKERERNVVTGRSLLEPVRGATEAQLASVLDVLGIQAERGVDGVFEDVGAGRLSVEAVERALAGDRPPKKPSESDRGILARVLRRVAGREDSRRFEEDQVIRITAERLTVGGRTGIISLSPCCNPVPGDPLVGFLQPGRGITAHVQGCPEALEQVEAQRVYLTWDPELRLRRPVTIEVRTVNKIGILAQMSRAFSHHDVNVEQANCRTYEEGRKSLNTFHATLSHVDQLGRLVEDLRRIRGVIRVERVVGDRPQGLPSGRSRSI